LTEAEKKKNSENGSEKRSENKIDNKSLFSKSKEITRKIKSKFKGNSK